jgi:predicted cupin superfamily sugar epimerase
VKDAAEVWHYHAGAALELTICENDGEKISRVLGADIPACERPQIVVPAGWWQTAKSLGSWTLCGCTVAPGFQFSEFELAEPGWEPSRDGVIR